MITNKLKINDSKTEFIVFRSPQLKNDFSGLSEIWESYSTNFSTLMIILLLYVEAPIAPIGKIRNLLSYDACTTIIHALISCRLDYCNYIMYSVPRSKGDRLHRLQNQCARILTKFKIESYIKW